jgi:hypothetical protein
MEMVVGTSDINVPEKGEKTLQISNLNEKDASNNYRDESIQQLL